jgi:hypothetical protein
VRTYSAILVLTNITIKAKGLKTVRKPLLHKVGVEGAAAMVCFPTFGPIVMYVVYCEKGFDGLTTTPTSFSVVLQDLLSIGPVSRILLNLTLVCTGLAGFLAWR